MAIIKVRFEISCASISCELSSLIIGGFDGGGSNVAGAAVSCNGAEVSLALLVLVVVIVALY